MSWYLFSEQMLAMSHHYVGAAAAAAAVYSTNGYLMIQLHQDFQNCTVELFSY